jgi:sterol desaturase/sphingolipid hydroxylase (fatty acid hydroxylase superfamily)
VVAQQVGITMLFDSTDSWSPLAKTMMFDVRIAAVITATLVADHYFLKIFRFNTTSGIKNPALTVFDVVRCFGFSMVSFLTISTHMGFTIDNRPAFSFEMPSMLQLAVYVPITLAVQDIYHYFAHRWIHSSNCPRILRQTHMPHHSHIHPTTGMLCTDLMAVNPIEYW